MKVGIVVHSGRAESREVATAGARLLTDAGVDVVVADEGDHPEVLDAPVIPRPQFADDLDLAISFGGDGTFLRAAHLCRDAGIPVLGVNLGRLGFLAEVERDDLHAAMGSVIDGAYETEDRSTLEVEAHGPHGDVLANGWALNEVSIEKSARQHMLFMDVSVGDHRYTTFGADALIVSTTTGSTAYALSAGGPIVSPHLDATLVVPVAPHSLFDRTLVCGRDEVVRVDLPDDQPPAVVSCDGRDPTLVPAGGHVQAVGGGRPVRLARVQSHDFYSLVRRKFGLR